MKENKFKAVMQRHDGVMYVSDGYGSDSGFLSYLFDFENNRWDKFLETITTEQRFVKLFPDEDEHLKGWTHIGNIQYAGVKANKGIKEFPDGKEIYEGYILKINTEENIWITKVGNHGVWHEIEVNDDNYDFMSINYIYDVLDCEIEVIGNIYENPELLENTK